MENKYRLQRITAGRPSVLLLFIILPYRKQGCTAAADAEFNPVFLQHIPGENTIDVKRFSHGQPVPAGEYYSDIWLNGEWKGRAVLRFQRSSGMDRTFLCLTPDLLSLLDLNEDALSRKVIKKQRLYGYVFCLTGSQNTV